MSVIRNAHSHSSDTESDLNYAITDEDRRGEILDLLDDDEDDHEENGAKTKKVYIKLHRY